MPGMERIGHQPDLLLEDAAVEPQEVAVLLVHLLRRTAEAHVVERDVGALVDRPVGPLLQRDALDAAAHARQREWQHAAEVAGIQTGAVDRLEPCSHASSRRRRSPAGSARWIEEECRRHDVGPAGENPAHLVERRAVAACRRRSQPRARAGRRCHGSLGPRPARVRPVRRRQRHPSRPRTRGPRPVRGRGGRGWL